jgi:hypothetical protein
LPHVDDVQVVTARQVEEETGSLGRVRAAEAAKAENNGAFVFLKGKCNVAFRTILF